ncbi:MAG TPA: transposase [Burkholderiales bacterium]|jgi:putative transposase|nr:transposase [Burkholderiales bacterium]
MARLPRFFTEGEAQHAIQRGNNREPTFTSERDLAFYLDCLRRASTEHGLAIHAYVLMTNHVHLLATPAHEDSLPKTLQSVGRRYVQYFNYTHRRSGTLWEGRYRATLVEAERYLLTCMRYIEMNPVRAAMVEHPADYPWSSYRTNAQGHPDPLVTPHELYRRLDRSDEQRQSAYRQLFRSQIPKGDLEAIRQSTHKAWVLGNDRFRAKIERLSGRRASPLPRGRPVNR